MSDPLISAEQLIIGRGDYPLAGPLTLRFGKGEIWQVSGDNGIGKTTLLRVLAGLLPPMSGSLIQHLDDEPRPLRAFATGWLAQIGWLPVQPAFKPGMTVAETLRHDRRLRPAPAAETGMAEALNRWSLAGLENLPVMHLSAGQRRRLDLLALERTGRSIWLMDEPTVTLDKAGRQTLANMLARHAKAGGLAIIASHEPLPRAKVQELKLAAFMAEAPA